MSERAAAVRPAAPAAAAAPARADANAQCPPERKRSGQEPGRIEPDRASARTAAPLAPPPLLRSDEAAPDFARIDCGGARIHDADLARARLTAQLLQELGRAFGLDLSRLEVQVDADAAIRIQARGANALQEDARVLLHPGRYRPHEAQGRYLLAHETAHAAQRALASAAPGDSVAAAEAEADAIGAAFARRESLPRPRVALRSARAAADTGKSETAEAVESPPLAGSVKTSRSRELESIREALDGWWVSDGDVFKVMRILDTAPFDVAVAMVGALDAQYRYWLADNINPPHMYQHRRSVLACYKALEPERYEAIDLKALRALPDSGLDLEETQALVYIVGNLPAPVWEELRASEKGEAIARLVHAPAPTPEVLEKLAKARKQAVDDEAALAQKRKRLLAHAKDQGANDLVAQIRERLQTPRDGDGEPRHPNATDAIAALQMLYPQLADDARFGYIGEQLERDGLVDLIIDLLPPDAFIGQSAPWQTQTLTALVQTRLPYRNEQLLEDLLSYHLLDWAIRDHEALFAYRLLQTLPMPAQYRFRQREGGKYYLRLIDNLPRDATTGLKLPVLEVRKAADKDEYERMLKLGAQGASEPGGWRSDTDTYYYDASGAQRQRLDQGDARKQLQALVAKFKDRRRGIYRDAEAIELYGDLVKLGAGSLESGHESAGDEILLQAYLRELDSLGYIDELFGELPESFLFDQSNRVATLKIILARDPLRVREQARELVSRGLFSDWMVKDWEAYLAFQCVKALPDDERQAFIRDNPDTWARIQSEMGPAMRQARDINAYVGDREGTDRAGVLAQLNDPEFWTKANEVALRGTLRMAMAMSEHRYAFERSQTFDVIGKQPQLATLIDEFRLWNPAAKRDKYEPEMLKGTRWYEEGVFASLRSLWGGLVTLWNMDVLFVDGKIGAQLDLNDVQKFMGGDLMGAQLAKPAKRGSKQEPIGAQTNKLTLLLDPGWLEGEGKSAELILPQLLIESTNIQRDGSTIQTGQVDLRQLHIRAAYDSQNQGQAAQAQVSLESLVANDVLYAKSRAMYTIAKLSVTALRLAAGSVDSTRGAPPAQRKGRYIPFPLLVLMVLPWLAQLAAVGLMAAGINRVRGLGDQGLEPDNRFGSDLTSRIRAIDMSFGSLTAEGFASSGGQRVAKAEVQDFAMRVGLNKATRLRAELASIAQRKAALQGRGDDAQALAELDARAAELEGQRAQVEKQEQEYLAIQAKIRAGGLTPAQQSQLQTDLDRLDFEDKGGAFLDIGKASVSGVEGTVTSAKPITLNHIHGQGSSSAMLGLLSSPTETPQRTAQRAQFGLSEPSLISPDRPGDFVLELGDVHTGRLSIAGGVLSERDLDAKLKELGDVSKRPELQALADSLTALKPKARRYQAMVAMGLSSLSATELTEFRALRKLLTADAALIVESIDLTRARLEVDLASGRVGLAARHADIAGLQLPQQGIEVERIVADGLHAGAIPANGLLDWSEWKKHLRDADVGVDSLRIDKARSKYHGLLFEKATLTGAYASVKQRGNLVEAGLKQLNIVGLGVVPRLGLLNQRLHGLREKARTAEEAEKPALEKEVAKLATLVAELQALADQRQDAYLRLQRAKTPEEIKTAKDAVAEVDGVIAYDLAQYGVANTELDEFGVKVSGAGDLLSDALGGGIHPLDVLERGGVTVTGTGGNNQRLFKRFALQQIQTAGHQPNSGLEGDAGSFEIGETRLDISAKKEKDKITVQVPKFEVDSLSLQQFLLTSSEGESVTQMWSDGASGIEGLKFSGSVELVSRVEGSRELADYRLSKAHIDSFSLDKLYGNGLGLKLSERKLDIAIASGSINGVHADGIDIDLPADKNAQVKLTSTRKGQPVSVGIDSIDKLVVSKALVDTWAGHGRLDARAIRVDLLQDGTVAAKIGDLDLTDTYVRGPDGWVRLTLKDFGTSLRYKAGALDIDDIHFGSLKVAGVHWKVGESGFVESNKPTTLTDFKLKGRIETREVPAKAKPGQTAKTERELGKVRIDSLHVGQVDSEELIYQDAENRVELRRAGYYEAREMTPFVPLHLQNLDVTGLEWTPEKKLSAGKIDLGQYETSAHYSAIGSALSAGVALKGRGMSVEVVGPGEYKVDVGKIDRTAGRLHTDKLDTRFGSRGIVGKVAIGPDYTEASGVEISGAMLADMKYTDAPKTLGLGSVTIDRIVLGKARQNYRLDPDPDHPGQTKKTPTTLAVSDLDLYGIVARTFAYHGESKGLNGEGVEESSTQDIKASVASIGHLHVGGFDSNALDGTSTLTDLKVEGTPRKPGKPGKQPFAIQGLSADLVNTLGDERTVKNLVANVNGGPLTADRIKFSTVKLGTKTLPDGSTVDIVHTGIDGGFVLNRLGLINPDLTLTDAKGKKTFIKGYGLALEAKGIKPQFQPNGTVSLPIQQVIARGLNISNDKDKNTIRIPLLRISNIAAGMRGMGTQEGIDFLAAKIGEIHVEGVEVNIVKEHKKELTDAEFKQATDDFNQEQAAEKKDPPGKLIVEPLSGLNGKISGEYDLDWWADPDIDASINGGVIDFSGMTNYAVRLHTRDVTRGGVTRPEDIITLGNGVDLKVLKDFKRKMPGFYGDSGPDDYGRINLRETIEGLSNEPGTAPERTYEAADGLNGFIGFSGELALGNGRIGRDKNGDGKLGDGDTWVDMQRDNKDQNNILLHKSNIGTLVDVEMPQLHFAGAGFTAGKTRAFRTKDGKTVESQTRLGRTAGITLNTLTIKIGGLAAMTMTVTLKIESGTITDIRIGDPTFSDAAGLSTVAAPDAKEVDRDATPLGAAP
ncbi:eCIS core domain-containing protein [Lysobacter enzymogenes]|uniref:eCIS core domain-containing protein n=3 Tax=Bacteria TaxID=2 RepID=A0AAU9APQ5_LYSEN|nr:DUF4157 domain-containing protein [Lysobacter enzymogenes]BAV96961.1 hypothetical protein LEN_1474 [Lysobacter enzymogenes]